MARHSFRILPLLLFAATCATAGLPPIIDPDAGRKLPQIQETGSLLAIDAPGTDNRVGTPPGMLAARLAENDKLFRWTPPPASLCSATGRYFIRRSRTRCGSAVAG